MSKIGIVWDERYLKHDTGLGHPERPQRLTAVKEVIDTLKNPVEIKPRFATHEEIGWVHTPELIQGVEQISQLNEGFFDGDTPFSPGSRDAAFLAAGGVLAAIDSVLTKEAQTVFAFPRPPGHHAEKNQSMGFCLFNNVAIGAEYLLRKKNFKKVAIVDIDVHHGNGTQHSFYDRSDVFYVSTHRFPFYPGTGAAEETGIGKGLGYTLNVPFTAYGDDEDYQKAYDEQIVPALESYQPDFVIVSAGFDAHIRDPLGGMKVTKKGFLQMASDLKKISKTSQGIIFVLEGGYDLKGLQEGVEAVFENF